MCKKTLESRHTAKFNEANNNSRPLPRQYVILLNKSLFLIQIPVCYHHINYAFLFFYFFTLFLEIFVHSRLFDHSSKAVGRQPKAPLNLNFQPENCFDMFNPGCSAIFVMLTAGRCWRLLPATLS